MPSRAGRLGIVRCERQKVCPAWQFHQRPGTQGRRLRLSGRTQPGAQALRLESQRRGNPGKDQAGSRAPRKHN